MGNRRNKRLQREKIYKKIRNISSWGTVVICLFLFAFFTVLVIFLSGCIAQYIGETKIGGSYMDIAHYAGLYEVADDTNGLRDFVDRHVKDYVVTDKDGNVLYTNGTNTCNPKGGIIALENGTQFMTIHQDTENGFLYAGEDKNIKFREQEFIKLIGKDIQDIKFPVWISVDMNGGENHFIGRIEFVFNNKDLILVMELFLGVVIELFIISIILIIFIVRSVINYRRVVRLYYSDVITGGHNWTWFLRYADDRIKSFRFRKNSFALVNISFVNYRNYCLCHSMSEGEELLTKIDKTISRMIRGYELSCHATTAGFALLLFYENDEFLTQRLTQLTRMLEAIDNDHAFVFQMGADVISPVTNSAGKIVRRKDFNIEKAFNNACSATDELSDTDASGIRIFDSKLLEDQRWVDTVQANQKRALANEEFVIYYQPKYNPNSLQLNGGEALIRWNSPEYGFIAPGRFIPIFEKNGFITEIDHYMISHVAADQKMWLDMGLKVVPVSVNVSRAHFAEKDLAVQIRDMVDRTGCPHNLLEIELTESAFFDDKNAMIETIKALKSFGFMVSMDDFGAGYSSLNSLKDMPLDVLKLDADFFRGEKGGDRADIVVSEAIKLAKNLNMMTVAEGVEDQEQVEFLARQGCDMIQGYYFARPMPKNEYAVRIGAAPAPQPVQQVPVAPVVPQQPAVPPVPQPPAAPQSPVQPAPPQPPQNA